MKLEEAVRLALEIMNDFEEKCAANEYTDTGEVWEIFTDIRGTLEAGLYHETPKPDTP